MSNAHWSFWQHLIHHSKELWYINTLKYFYRRYMSIFARKYFASPVCTSSCTRKKTWQSLPEKYHPKEITSAIYDQKTIINGPSLGEILLCNWISSTFCVYLWDYNADMQYWAQHASSYTALHTCITIAMDLSFLYLLMLRRDFRIQKNIVDENQRPISGYIHLYT